MRIASRQEIDDSLKTITRLRALCSMHALIDVPIMAYALARVPFVLADGINHVISKWAVHVY